MKKLLFTLLISASLFGCTTTESSYDPNKTYIVLHVAPNGSVLNSYEATDVVRSKEYFRFKYKEVTMTASYCNHVILEK